MNIDRFAVFLRWFFVAACMNRFIMDKLSFYLDASVRENTQKSYAMAVKHYEIEWQGLLPATADDISRYIAHYADQLSINTLRQRVAALSQWHIEQGFPDPTKTPLLKKLFKGIQTVHITRTKQAKALQLDDLKRAIHYLDHEVITAQAQGNFIAELKLKRNKSLLLLGFWRGFRGDELTRLLIQDIQVIPDQGMICYLGQSKGDRQLKGQSYKVPALMQLCPVKAYLDWIEISQLENGEVFRGINRWGKISDQSLHVDSLIPLLRETLKRAGIANAHTYTMHSLRRGFANWANTQGWDTKTLMQYVGWKNVNSAMRYIDGDSFDFSSLKLEHHDVF